MGWVKIDDNFSQHPKVIKAGPLGMAMQIAALCYCNRYLTDGFIPRAVVPSLLNLEGIGMRMWDGELFGGGENATWQLVVEDLLDAGLWEEVEGGYQIHDYLDYQPSKAQVLAEREATAKRVNEYRARQKAQIKKSNGGSNEGVTPLQTDYKRVSNKTPDPGPSILSTTTPLPPPPTGEGEQVVAVVEKGNGEKTIGEVARFVVNSFIPGAGLLQVERICSWVNEGMDPDAVIYAMEIALLANIRRVDYIEAILKRWHSAGITTRAQAEAAEAEYKARAGSSKKARGRREEDSGGVVYADLTEKLAELNA